MRTLRAKNEMGFVDGTIIKPDQNDSLRSNWERCNDMVVSWLQNSISPPLRSSVAFVYDVVDIWSELQEQFAQQNRPIIYELKRALNNLTQGEDAVSTYYGKLKSLWDKLAVYESILAWSCGNLKLLTERYQRDCVIQFLMGLQDTNANMRNQIMLMEPLQTVNKAFS